MEGFTLKYGNDGNLPLNFPINSPIIDANNFVPKGDFSVIPPDNHIVCNGINVTFSPTNFSGPPAEHLVRNMIW